MSVVETRPTSPLEQPAFPVHNLQVFDFCTFMSSHREGSPEEPPARRSSSASSTLSVTAPALPRRVSPPNVILFLDSNQDARTTRSAIQRHTAHHAAAQRREARLRSSREVIRPRNLGWQRRPGTDTPVSSASDTTPPNITISTPSESTEPVQQPRPGIGADQATSAGQRRQLSQPLAEIVQGSEVAMSSIQERATSSPVLRSIGDDEASNNLLRAFELALHAQLLPPQNPRHWQAREESLDCMNYGLSILRQRLASEHDNCSDPTIQAVLVLFVYATRFQTPGEVGSHRDALERMIRVRGGLASFAHNPVLEEQLQHYVRGEVEKILHVMSASASPS